MLYCHVYLLNCHLLGTGGEAFDFRVPDVLHGSGPELTTNAYQDTQYSIQIEYSFSFRIHTTFVIGEQVLFRERDLSIRHYGEESTVFYVFFGVF